MIVTKCVHAYANTFALTDKDSAFHTLDMDLEVVDSDGYHDDIVDPSRLTFADGGVFLVFGNPQWTNPGGTVTSRLTVNGTSVGYVYTTNGLAAAPTTYTGPMLFWLDDLSPGDYMESQTSNNNGGTGLARTQMCALEVSEWSCHAAATGSQSASPGDVNLTFGTTIYDPHSMVTSSSRFTAQKAGYYLVLSNVRGAAITAVTKNSSGARLNGSTSVGGGGQGLGAADYVVDWFEVGDYVEVILYASFTVTDRQFAMVFLGDSDACLGYTYNSVDSHSNDPGFSGPILTDSEWVDPCNGHPQSGGDDATFNMLEGYHFALAKISTSGGTFLQNDGCFITHEGVQLGNVFSTNRHASGSQETTLAFACFEASFGDTMTGFWVSSGLYVEAAYSPYTNVFVTDTAAFPPPDPSITAYQRMYGWRASIDDNALETVEVFTSPQGFTS